jgi:ATP-dependent Clp protease ATP-binding subunit ClpC
VFHSLTKEEIRQIVDLEMDRVREQLKEQDITLEITVEAKDLLGKEGYDHTYGARPLRRVIQNRIEDPLAEGLLNQKFSPGSTIKVDAKDDEITLERVEELVPA